MVFLRIAIVAMMMIFMARAAMADESTTCVVEQHFYYPRDGRMDDALAVRLKSAELRAKLGLPTDRLFVIERASQGHPLTDKTEPWQAAYLMSLTEYANEGALHEAHQRLLQSKEYRTLLNEMGKMLEDFRMAIWRPVWGGCGMSKTSE